MLPKRPMLAACLLAMLLTGPVPGFAATVGQTIQSAFDTMASTESEAEFSAAITRMIALGNAAIPDLTQRLIAAKDDSTRTQLSYVLARILSRTGSQGQPTTVPQALFDHVGKLLLEPRESALEANLANLAAFMPGHPAELTPGLLALLERSHNEGMRATTTVAIGRQGEGALPLVQQALLNTDNDRFAGDLARIFDGRELPKAVEARLRSLLQSKNDQARRNAARVLERAGKSDGLLAAALRDLAAARSEVELSFAASKVRKHTDGSPEVALALAQAYPRAHRAEERLAIVDALAATGEPGKSQIVKLIEAADDPDEIRHLGMGANSRLGGDPRLPQAYIAILKRTDNERASDAALFNLVMTHENGRRQVEAMLAVPEVDGKFRQRLQLARDLFRTRKN